MTSNAAWTADEIILALAFYFEHGYRPATDPLVEDLSRLLKSLPTEGHREPDFRNANSVSMRLANFHHVDPGQSEGLRGISAEARRLFDLYNGRQAQCQRLAEAIAVGAQKGLLEASSAEDETEDLGAVEGGFLTRLHRFRERDRSRVAAKLREARRSDGQLCCEVCGLDESAIWRAYGEIRGELFECHHTKPLEYLTEATRTYLADLAVLCPTCHRAIHRIEPLPTLEEMQRRYPRH